MKKPVDAGSYTTPRDTTPRIGTTSSVPIIADSGLYGIIDFAKATKPVRISLPGKSTSVNDGDTVLNFSSPAFWFPKKAESKTETSLSVAFGDNTPVTGQDVSDTVEDLVRAVEAIILEAEPRFFR